MTLDEAKEKLIDILAEATEDEDAVCYVTSDDADALDMAIKALETKPHWIPIEEKLPEDGEWCLFTDGTSMSIERYKYDAIDHFFPPARWFQVEDVIAWMPLPEPARLDGKEAET